MSAIDEGPGAGESSAESDSEGVSAGVGGGILGNLPNSRPSVRSPRRAGSGEERAAPDHVHASHKSGVEEREAPSRPRSEPAPDSPTTETESPEESELEALARGGIAAAGAVASTGLRIAGRAAARLRDVIEPR